MNTSQPRKPAGVPVGGQFANKTQPAPGYSLDSDPPTPLEVTLERDRHGNTIETTVLGAGRRFVRVSRSNGALERTQHWREGELQDPENGSPAVVLYRGDGATVEATYHYRDGKICDAEDNEPAVVYYDTAGTVTSVGHYPKVSVSRRPDDRSQPLAAHTAGMSTSQPRKPAGVPTGGQFSTKTQPAPGYALDTDGVCDECGAEMPHGFGVGREHDESCSMHPDSVGGREVGPPPPGTKMDTTEARALPIYTEVLAEFSRVPGRKFRLMARGGPETGTGIRRFTNLDTGFEVFVAGDGSNDDGTPMFSHIEIAGPR